MILDKQGETFTSAGKTFAIGGMVFANAEDEYSGLVGHIIEIRTGEDKETQNSFPDVYCNFETPQKPGEIVELEERFSEIYAEKKTIEDICLDYVIMAPEMLEPVAESVQPTDQAIFALTYKKDGDIEGALGASADRSLLIRRMLDMVKEQKSTAVLIGSEENASGAHYSFSSPEWETDKVWLEFDLFSLPFYPVTEGGAAA